MTREMYRLRDIDNRGDDGAPFEFTVPTLTEVVPYVDGPLRGDGEEPMTDHVDIVFDGPPEHVAGRFVEVEDAQGQGLKFGEWVERPDGYWALRIDVGEIRAEAQVEVLTRLSKARRINKIEDMAAYMRRQADRIAREAGIENNEGDER